MPVENGYTPEGAASWKATSRKDDDQPSESEDETQYYTPTAENELSRSATYTEPKQPDVEDKDEHNGHFVPTPKTD